MEKRVAIVGAGLSGLLACKYILEIGLHPIVFEADDGIGGQWRHTIESTKIQNPRQDFQFSDFPWDSSVKENNPSTEKVQVYINSYAQHFSLIPYVRFNSKVIDIDYVGESNEEMKSWGLWSGNGSPFGSKGIWHITIEDTKNFRTEVHKAEFVILCIGKFSGLSNIPEFPFGKGPEVFKGKVMHSMDYAALDNKTAAELIKNKRVTVIGSRKSAHDLATECAVKNGVTHPCTMILRNVHWFIPNFKIWGFNLAFLYFNRFSELFVHKPGEHFLLSLLATLLSPLRWGMSKLVETYLKWNLPLKKYGLLPNHSFHQDMYKCSFGVLPELFYDKVKEGSLVIKKSQNFSFSKEGLIIDGETKPLETDVVIFATGFNGNQKLRNIFKSPIFQNYINGSTNANVPLYRQIIHPRIPQLAIIGYGQALSHIYSNEIKCQWLAQFLDGNIKLPNIKEMEKEPKLWEDTLKKYDSNWKSCIVTCAIWYNDQLCKDMKCNHLRKKGLLKEVFEPYGPTDYSGLVHK
ncbi:unnamed protein product [Trifolium pratense]|uniref:Uncharacterized protein n=1 Tax=Trifolium pratense TaxID=57577 RepID=A0ACB0KM64_TRIPR|nr:unnamed protein product [Trifolium pratense]